MIACPQCGAENKEKDIDCYRCGFVLKTTKDTRQFEPTEDSPVIPKRRWGTARFENQTIVLFHVRSYDTPIHAAFVQDEIVLGRGGADAPVDVDLTNYGALEAGVSRRHALLRRQNDTVQLVDLESANSTFLNGQRIIPNDPRILRDGDEIRLGRLVVRVTFEDAPDFQLPKEKK
jgi:hypothetical protein